MSPVESQREFRLFQALDTDGDGFVPVHDLWHALGAAGLERTDGRLVEVKAALDALISERLDYGEFTRAIASAGLLVERALQGHLAIADFADFTARVDEMFQVVSANRSGEQARYIPPLADVDPERFGLAVVTIDGQVLTRGDANTDFSIQSTCKPFNYCIALEDLGEEAVHRHIGREPSGQRFNAYVLQDDNRPHNPLINAGAIMCAALIKPELPLHRRFEHIRQQWARLTGGEQPRFNAYMAQEEARTGDRNRALAYMMKNEGSFPGGEDAEDHEIRAALDLYFRACSLELTAREMATAAATLANGGVCPVTQERVLSPATVRACLSLMHSCGMYDYSGEFAFSIGIPAKSGVGGAVLLVVPGMMGICIWSPRLDRIGNSVRGVDFARRLTQVYRLHMYDLTTKGDERLNPRVSRTRSRAALVSQALWAASTGDVRTLRRMLEEGSDLERGDYDQRTPIHLAAAEGHRAVVELMLRSGVSPNLVDRWGGTPLDDARKSGHTHLIALLEERGAKGGRPVHLCEDDRPVDSPALHADPEAVVELLWAASQGDLPSLRRLVALGVPLHAADYDGRTALHLAAAEGREDAVRYLLSHGHPLGCRDRWGSSALDEARREGRDAVVGLLSAPAA